jgi:tRNA pseudouridine(38-40) synthase
MAVRATAKRKVALIYGYNGHGYRGSAYGQLSDSVDASILRALRSSGLIDARNWGDDAQSPDPRVLSKVSWKSASRTDKGVHSLGNVASLKVEVDRTVASEPAGLDAFLQAKCEEMNKGLTSQPGGLIRVLGMVRQQKAFCARTSCANRSYTYMLPQSLLDRLDMAVFNRSCRLIATSGADSSEHCFQNFTGTGTTHGAIPLASGRTMQRLSASWLTPASTPWQDCLTEANGLSKRQLGVPDSMYRRVTALALEADASFAGLRRLNIAGDSFMYHMIRKIVGVLVAESLPECTAFPPGSMALALAAPLRLPVPLAPAFPLVHSESAFMLRDPLTQRKQKLPQSLMSTSGHSQIALSNDIFGHISDQFSHNAVWDAWLDELSSLHPIPAKQRKAIDADLAGALRVLGW